MVEVREVLLGWLDGVGLRTVAVGAGMDSKTARCAGGCRTSRAPER
jgi:hypothetical protein